MGKLFSLLFAGVFLLSGCSSLPAQTNVSADPQLWKAKQKIGVYVSPIPKITTSYPGAVCLLCYAAASMANSSLTKQVETYQAKQLEKTKDNIVSLLKAKGVDVVVIDTLVKEDKLPKLKPAVNPHITRDFSAYKTSHDVDQLLVVNFVTVGVVRNYSSYVPTGAPQAVVSAQFYMIDTKSNNFSLFNPLNISRGAEGEWDKPPAFPGITNAFYQAEEQAVDQIKDSLK